MNSFSLSATKRIIAVITMVIGLPLLVFSQREIPVTTSSKEALALFLEGRDKFDNVDIPAAARLFDQALEKDPDFALANLYRSVSGGGSNVTRPRLERAVALADKVSSGERLQILASKASTDGDRPAYKRYLDELLKLHPNAKRARYFMADYYNSIGDAANYISWLLKTLEIDNNFTPVYDRLGYAYKNTGKFKEAAEAFKKEIELAPHVANAYDSYAELLLKWGKFDESMKLYQTAMEKDPEYKTALRGIGLNHMHKRDFVRAREYFERYNNEAPQANGKLDALANLTYSYLHEWNMAEALKAADRHLQLAEKEKIMTSVVTNHIWRTMISVETGKPEEAAGHLNKAKSANESPAISAGVRGNNEVNLALIGTYVLAATKDFPGARKELANVRTLIDKRGLSVEDQSYYTAAGYVEIMQGSYDKALEMLQKGNPADPLNIFRLATAYERKGDAAQAKKWFQAVVDWNWTGSAYAITRPQAMKKIR